MSILIKELENKSILTQNDGVVLDFRDSGYSIFMIDTFGKVIKPNKRYKVSIEIINEYVEDKDDIKVESNIINKKEDNE